VDRLALVGLDHMLADPPPDWPARDEMGLHMERVLCDALLGGGRQPKSRPH
jgi:hypothetical protein